MALRWVFGEKIVELSYYLFTCFIPNSRKQNGYIYIYIY